MANSDNENLKKLLRTISQERITIETLEKKVEQIKKNKKTSQAKKDLADVEQEILQQKQKMEKALKILNETEQKVEKTGSIEDKEQAIKIKKNAIEQNKKAEDIVKNVSQLAEQMQDRNRKEQVENRQKAENEFENSAENKLEGINTLQEEVFTRLSEIKNSVDTVIQNEFTRLGIDAKTLPEYSQLGAKSEKEFFEKVPQPALCDIIAKYSIDEYITGKNGDFEDKLEKAYKRKSSKKTALKKQVEEIIEMYNKLLLDNQNKLQTMDQEINDLKVKKSEQEKVRSELEKQLGTIGEPQLAKTDTSKLTPDELKDILTQKEKRENIEAKITEVSKRIKDLEKEITSKKDIKDALVKLNEKYIMKIKAAKTKFENEFYDKSNVDVGSYSKEEKGSESAKTNENNLASGNRINSLINTNATDKEIAKNMLVDIKNMDEKNLISLINQYGYKDLYDMSQNLGPLAKIELRKILKGALEGEQTNQWKCLGKKIDLSEGIGSFSKDQIVDLVNQINSFREVDFHSVEEREEFEKKVEALNLATLLSAANQNKMQQFLSKFTSTGNATRKLNMALSNFSNIRRERGTTLLNKANDFRTILQASQKRDDRPRAYVNKGNTNQIRQNRSLQDR